MNILLLSRYITPDTGGGEYVISLMAELVAKKGNMIWVISNKIEGTRSPQHKNLKIIFLLSQTIQDVKHWKQKNKLLYSLLAIKNGLSIIRKEKIDIIHSHPNQPAIVGWILSLITRKPHIITIHDIQSLKQEYLEEWVKQKGNSKFKAKIASTLTKIIHKLNYTAIHTVSENTRDDLIKLGIKKPIYVIHNAIPIHEPENIETVPFQFVHISRLEFHKNLQVVIRCIPIVKKFFPNILLLVIGEGGYRDTLEKLVVSLNLQKNVIFKGHVSDNEKKFMLSSSNALLFPSLHEGFGMVILEAFAQRKPVIVSRIRPMSDIVEHERTGLVVSPHDEKAWANSILYLLQYPKEASKMGENGRNVIEEKYCLEFMSNQIMQMYSDIMKSYYNK